MERQIKESQAIGRATGEEQQNNKVAGVNELQASQLPKGGTAVSPPQGDTPGDTALTQDLKEEGEWRTVVYRKQATSRRITDLANKRAQIQAGNNKWCMGKPRNPIQGRFVASEVQIAYKSAMKEGRCLRCLSKGHKRAQCRDPIRCFKCKSLGHQSGRCRQLSRGERAIKREQRGSARITKFVTKEHSFLQALTTDETLPTKTVAQKEMDFEEEEPFLNERPDESHVYSAARGALRPENEYLDRTGMIIMLQGAPTPDLPRDIARTFARRHGWQWQDYEVLPATDSPFLVICPGMLIRDQVVLRGVYRIRPGVVIRVLEWGVDLNMAYNPPPCEAWIRLIHLPLQAWNPPEIRKTTTQLGLITGIMPYGRAAGHFKHITLRLACDDPADIPKHLMYHEGELTTRVRVRLLRWRFYENNPYPLHPERPQPHRNPRNPPRNQNEPHHHHQDNQDNHQQGSGTTTVEVSVNNYSSGSNSQAPNRRGAEMEKLHHSQVEMNQQEATQKTTELFSEKVDQDQNVANLPGEKHMVQIGESMRLLIISPRAQRVGQGTTQRSLIDGREARGVRKDMPEGIFVDKGDSAEGKRSADESSFNEGAEYKDVSFNGGLINEGIGVIGSHGEEHAGSLQSELSKNPIHLGFNLGPKNITEEEISKAQQMEAQQGAISSPLILQVTQDMQGNGPAQRIGLSAAEQTQGSHTPTGLSDAKQIQGSHTPTAADNEIEEEASAAANEKEEEIAFTPARKRNKSKQGKENSVPVRRSARVEAKASAQQGYYRNMEKGPQRQRLNEKDKLRIDFQAKRDEISHNLAMDIIAASGLATTDQIKMAFEEAAAKDAIEAEIDNDLQALTGHDANV